MSQTSYTSYMSTAYDGLPVQIDYAQPARNNAATDQAFGLFVAFDGGAGTTDQAIRPMNASGDIIQGVVLWDAAHDPSQVLNGIPQNGQCSVLRHGTVWVRCEQAMTPADPVFVRYTLAGATGTSPALGKIRKDADTAKAVAVPRCQVVIGAAAGELCLVQVNLP
jgi:hypothetical protein